MVNLGNFLLVHNYTLLASLVQVNFDLFYWIEQQCIASENPV